MPVSVKATGSWAAVTSGVTPTLVGSPAVGNRYFVWVVWKPYSTTCSVEGWTKVAEYADGSVGSGEGVGSVKVACFYRDWESGMGGPPISFSSTPFGFIAGCLMQLWQKTTAEPWDTPDYRTAPLPLTQAYSINADSPIDVPNGAAVMAVLGIRNDAAFGFGQNTLSAGPVRWVGLPSSPQNLSTSTGNDLSARYWHGATDSGGAAVSLALDGQLERPETGAALWVVQDVTALAAASFSDDFAHVDNTKWASYGGGTPAGGQLVLSHGVAARSLERYDLVGSSVCVQLVSIADGPGAVLEFGHGHGADVMVSIGIRDGKLINQDDEELADYSPVDHQWLRIREDGGTTYLEAGADRFSFTVVDSFPTPDLVDRGIIRLLPFGTTVATFAHLNPSPPPEGQASGTITYAGSAVGALNRQGQASGTISLESAAAVGHTEPLAGTSGAINVDSTATTGYTEPAAQASGTLWWNTIAAGQLVPSTGSGALHWSSTAVGHHAPKADALPAALSWVSTTAIGQREPSAQAAGQLSLASTAVATYAPNQPPGVIGWWPEVDGKP